MRLVTRQQIKHGHKGIHPTHRKQQLGKLSAASEEQIPEERGCTSLPALAELLLRLPPVCSHLKGKVCGQQLTQAVRGAGEVLQAHKFVLKEQERVRRGNSLVYRRTSC